MDRFHPLMAGKGFNHLHAGDKTGIGNDIDHAIACFLHLFDNLARKLLVNESGTN